jgi:hypothetical protein
MYEIVIVRYVGMRGSKLGKESRNNEERGESLMQCGGRIWVEEVR